MSDQNALIAEFVNLTGASAEQATQYLAENRWDLSSAAVEYYQAQEEDATTGEAQEEEDDPMENYTGPRTLDGRPAPSAIPTIGSSSGSAARQAPRRGIATLGSLGQGSGAPHAGHGHAHDDDDDSDDEDYHDEEGEPRDLFAGGEKSALAVQDPRRQDPRSLVNDIIKKAKSNAKRPPADEPSASSSHFRGTGMTLGGDDTPSQAIPDPRDRLRSATSGPPVTRVLHIWQDGFSIEDGPLRRFDDPANAADLALIRSGRAPVHLMNVALGQSVDVQLNTHEEPYKQQPKAYKPFSGGGQRLGSPTPGSPSRSSAAPAPGPSILATSSSSAAPSTQEVTIDPAVPTISLRIQLADGTRLPARFNTTHTIGDIYDFIGRASSAAGGREWVVATTFPNKEHKDKSLVLGDMAEFKRGGTAVQKWA